LIAFGAQGFNPSRARQAFQGLGWKWLGPFHNPAIQWQSRGRVSAGFSPPPGAGLSRGARDSSWPPIGAANITANAGRGPGIEIAPKAPQVTLKLQPTAKHSWEDLTRCSREF